MTFWQEARHAIEVKIRRETETEALDQIGRYLDRAGLGEGWLVMFDLCKDASWADGLFVREVAYETKRIRIVGAGANPPGEVQDRQLCLWSLPRLFRSIVRVPDTHVARRGALAPSSVRVSLADGAGRVAGTRGCR